MTPFGARIRHLRKQNGVTMKDMARDLALSSAYLSALEHGYRGRPAPGLVQQMAGYFELFGDDVEDLKELARLSHPKVTVDTSGLTPDATRLANLLAGRIRDLSDDEIAQIIAVLK